MPASSVYHGVSRPPCGYRPKPPDTCAPRPVMNRLLPSTKFASPLFMTVGPVWFHVVSGGRLTDALRPYFSLSPRKYVYEPRIACDTCAVPLKERLSRIVWSGVLSSVSVVTSVLPYA